MLISKVRTRTPVFCQWCFIVAATAALSHLLYSLDLVSHYHGILFADLGGSLGLVIIGTVVLVRVPVDAAEQVATATVETCEAHSLAAHKAPVLLRFGGVTLTFLTARRGYRSRARSSRLAYNRL